MKSITKNINSRLTIGLLLILCTCIMHGTVFSQTDSTTAVKQSAVSAKPKPVKNTFESVWIIDNQTALVPVKGSFEMDIMHRFGVVTHGYKDFWGVFAPSNIRLGVDYAPIKNLYIGIGITKIDLLWDASAKYAIFTQTPGKWPVSLTYYGDVAVDTRQDPDGSLFKYSSQRLSFFNQLIIARKISSKLSVQIAPSISHQNSVNGYYTGDSAKTLFKEMNFNHFAVAFDVRYKVTRVTSLLFNYDQPLTTHNTNNPNPNISLGVEFNTSNHSFQLFFTNYYLLNPQKNNLYNSNNPFGYTNNATGMKVPGGQFLVGFNITRLWNY